ncbi:hypothetical protein QQF64_013205 [Cirrhinus molitorella]|uniref:Endonuclease domain-containing 1 protein-like n=1 Tax=Cirrhinus molitorella TaxID=172907 RepID=A0ABR3LTS3_9TELE
MRFLVVSALLVYGFPLVITEVVDSFSTCSDFFLIQQPPVIPGILENSASQDNNRYKLICQNYQNAYKFATLYDTTNKIPVFSAYRYTGYYIGERHFPWKIEPQLETSDAAMKKPCVNQASPEDYWRQDQLDRGHLFPNGQTANKITAECTFTLTNTVPQYKNFNKGIWVTMEKTVRNTMNSHCRDKDNVNNILAYVLTGAVPSPANLLNDRVNIPSFMWTVFCCYNHGTKKWTSQAHWAEHNNHNEVNTINAINLEQFTVLIQNNYRQGSKLFSTDCSTFLDVNEG